MTLFIFMRVFLATIMIAAACLKLLSIPSFKRTLLQLGIFVRNPFIGVLFIVGLEFAAGILMFWDAVHRWGLLLNMILIAGYCWAVWRTVRSKMTITCNCFGDLMPNQLGRKTVYRIALLFLITIALYWGDASIKSTDGFEILIAMLISIAVIAFTALSKSFIDYKKIV
ncbi:hypothetical protein LQV63_10850 [Paenibacillus profundus]|uniref:Methylamine utilisation protein MauE domain-containing protein n=1 Tax=Paenibacillus profundus TaxID=1173085 RepID=A0ABS8YCR3_9BACL|nr:MauE/DoxX family redox-associated membrane protein [Paenibacillus profundus]MCE5169811.1 hypothetical protein [Paenibacillus profundus]